jgi:hypothetical protein
MGSASSLVSVVYHSLPNREQTTAARWNERGVPGTARYDGDLPLLDHIADLQDGEGEFGESGPALRTHPYIAVSATSLVMPYIASILRNVLPAACNTEPTGVVGA